MNQQLKELECLRDVVRNNIVSIKGCLVEAEKRFETAFKAIETYQETWEKNGFNNNEPNRKTDKGV